MMKMRTICFLLLLSAFFFTACGPETDGNATNETDTEETTPSAERMIPIKTTVGTFNVWTKKVGDNPDKKVLLLHGGPGATHEYFEIAENYLPDADIEFYYYDQLESAGSDQPNDSTLWSVDRFVDEVEQVRTALGLDSSNFYLLGHSWGGILTMEYALKHQDKLKGIIISNMMASAPEYTKYANEVLINNMDPEVAQKIKAMEAEGKYTDPAYQELVYENYYTQHVLRRPVDEWPDPVNRAFEKLNYDFYNTMQGPSEFGMANDPKLGNWDVSDRLGEIKVPALVIGAEHDTMDPDYKEWMAEQLPAGRYLYCPEGSHMAMWDDTEIYFSGLVNFINDVDLGKEMK